MQSVVGDGNEGIGCPAQELHSLTLQHCEGHLPRGRGTLSPGVSHSSIPLPDLWDPRRKRWAKAGQKSPLHSNSTRQQLYRKTAFLSLGLTAP